MERCQKHKVEFVRYWIDSGQGKERLVKGCPKCNNLSNWTMTCPKCNWITEKWIKADKQKKTMLCENCGGTGKRGTPFVSVRHIPGWRLNIDDTKPGEVLENTAETYGMKPMSSDEWKAFYESDQEQEKEREFNEQKKKLEEEILGSPDLAIPKTS